jgi:hypothetical protein
VRIAAALFLFSGLAACGAEAESSSPDKAKISNATQGVAVFECRTEYNDVPKGFVFKKKTPDEQSATISDLESSFRRDFSPLDKYRATYRYLSSGSHALSETAMYINDGPAYANYMAMKGGKLASILCLSKNLVPGATFSSSNTADLVAAEIGAEFGSLIRGAP